MERCGAMCKQEVGGARSGAMCKQEVGKAVRSDVQAGSRRSISAIARAEIRESISRLLAGVAESGGKLAERCGARTSIGI